MRSAWQPLDYSARLEADVRRREFLKAGAATAAASLCPGERTRAAEAPKPAMKVLLWCWDARMMWDDEPDAIVTKMAASERAFPYPKKPESFQTGFRRLTDYCAKTGIYGFIVWGFLRDCHGGIKAAADLCNYAADRGVAVLPGVGLCSYGGYYFEGDHPFSLESYLRKYPSRISTAQEEGGGRKVTPVLDPALKANQDWWRDGLEWMLDTFAIGGIDYEMGDFIVNPSPAAEAARAALGYKADGNIMDVVVATQDLMRRAAELKPDSTFINCTYRGMDRITGFPKMPYVDSLPSNTVWEYTLDSMVRRAGFPDAFAGAPPHRMYGYVHWFNPSTKTVARDYVPDIARVFPGLRKIGFEFAGTYGEVSALGNPLADRNYRAQAAWAENATLNIEDF